MKKGSDPASFTVIERYHERWLRNHSRSNISDINVGENLTPDCRLDEVHHRRAKILPKIPLSRQVFLLSPT